jgi:hypothetical protein
MTAAVCPYCRGVIDSADGNEKICEGCGTPHHADCYAENGGCTVFGCKAAPAEEPKLHLTGSEISNVGALAPRPTSSTLGLEPPAPVAPPAPAVRVKAPPPPIRAGAGTPAQPVSLPVPRFGTGSVLFGTQPVAAVAAAPSAAPMAFDLEPNPNAKNRMTFIVLGVLLGAVGAHNFYAGYRGKATAQLCISVLSFGFGSPMSWIWAVIDICTVDRDSNGIQFKA